MKEITLEQAQQIAAREIERLRSDTRLAGYEFGPVVLMSEEDVSWTFVSGSKQLHNEGCAPGALFVIVDKRDGHIWTESEVESYYESLATQNTHQPVCAA